MTNSRGASSGARVYVASLSDYNAGILHGEWVDLDGLEADELAECVAAMLAASPTAAREGLPAEEYAIHDYEGYGPIHLGEHESLERVCALAGMIDEHGDIFAVWYDQADGRHYDDPADRFAETYRGSFPSLADYAEELVSGDVSPKILNAPLLWGTVGGFIDYDQIAHDLECSGEILTIDHDGMVHVWCTS